MTNDFNRTTWADLTVVFADEIMKAPYHGDVWAWIQARTRAANFEGIHVGDYIPFVAGGNAVKAEVAGIDTYYNYCGVIDDALIGHHIDFISRDCWPEPHQWNRVNYNNGLPGETAPWMCSDIYAWLNSLNMRVPNAETANPATIEVDYRSTGVYDKLPAELKAVIKQKRALIPRRFTDTETLLGDDNAGNYRYIGNLWLPSEYEACGIEHWGSKNGWSTYGYVFYPIFNFYSAKRIKGIGDGGERAHWWTSSASGKSSTKIVFIAPGGDPYPPPASETTVCVPLCFRIM